MNFLEGWNSSRDSHEVFKLFPIILLCSAREISAIFTAVSKLQAPPINPAV